MTFYLLTFTRVLKATVYNGSEQLGFEEKVSKARRVEGHVAAFDRLLSPAASAPFIPACSYSASSSS